MLFEPVVTEVSVKNATSEGETRLESEILSIRHRRTLAGTRARQLAAELVQH